jgi:hypothetical protein
VISPPSLHVPAPMVVHPRVVLLMYSSVELVGNATCSTSLRHALLRSMRVARVELNRFLISTAGIRSDQGPNPRVLHDRLTRRRRSSPYILPLALPDVLPLLFTLGLLIEA